MKRRGSKNLLYILEQHDQLLELWRYTDAKYLNITHLDFHCDMRGLLVDYNQQLAYPATNIRRLDEGNYLTQAILEGRVQSIHWIHDIPGGRKYDVGTVIYMTDLSVKSKRWLMALKRQKAIPINYKVTEFGQWNGILEEDFLDIDWDFFAAKDYSPNSIDKRVEAFFNRNFVNVPKHISVCYSPRFSHPSRELFDKFVDRLATLFQAEIVHITPNQKIASSGFDNRNNFLNKFYYSLRYQIKRIHYEATLWLRKKNIY